MSVVCCRRGVPLGLVAPNFRRRPGPNSIWLVNSLHSMHLHGFNVCMVKATAGTTEVGHPRSWQQQVPCLSHCGIGGGSGLRGAREHVAKTWGNTETTLEKLTRRSCHLCCHL